MRLNFYTSAFWFHKIFKIFQIRTHGKRRKLIRQTVVVQKFQLQLRKGFGPIVLRYNKLEVVLRVRWVVEFLTRGYKISFILSTKWMMSFKEITEFCELTYTNWAFFYKTKVYPNLGKDDIIKVVHLAKIINKKLFLK